jgi:hypothetical protein
MTELTTLEDVITGRDQQLEAAVSSLLEGIR